MFFKSKIYAHIFKQLTVGEQQSVRAWRERESECVPERERASVCQRERESECVPESPIRFTIACSDSESSFQLINARETAFER